MTDQYRQRRNSARRELRVGRRLAKARDPGVTFSCILHTNSDGRRSEAAREVGRRAFFAERTHERSAELRRRGASNGLHRIGLLDLGLGRELPEDRVREGGDFFSLHDADGTDGFTHRGERRNAAQKKELVRRNEQVGAGLRILRRNRPFRELVDPRGEPRRDPKRSVDELCRERAIPWRELHGTRQLGLERGGRKSFVPLDPYEHIRRYSARRGPTHH
jgi:hypothetical protein